MKQLSEQLQPILNRVAPLRAKAYRFRVVLFVMAVATIYGLILYRINVYANVEPDAVDLSTKLTEVKRVSIDQEATSKIQDLENRDITIEALFDNGRDNPFQE